MKAMRERDIKAAQSGQNAKENLGINSDDDEDDAEWKARCAKLHPTPYKWTDEGESLLEECLIKVAFDFDQAAEVFEKRLNKPLKDVYYKFTPKQLQLRWTDIEIRKYRLNADQTPGKP